jgi:plastocyanin domain-containing protein
MTPPRPLLLLAVTAHAVASTAWAAGPAPGSAVPVGSPEHGAPAVAGPGAQRVDIRVTESGFEPRRIRVKRGRPTTLAFTRTTDRTCMKAIDIPDEGVKGLALPLNRTVTVTITPKRAGSEPFQCSAMGMGGGRIVVEE